MKKQFIVVLGFVFLLFIVVILGYFMVSADKEVYNIKDVINSQSGVEKYFSTYGYTIDNPNVIVNPYDISPLTALILFETEDEVSVHVEIVGKDENSSFKNNFSKEKKHIIPIYGLYPNVENKVILSYDNKSYETIIETKDLPDDFSIGDVSNAGNDLLFINSGKYPYAIDKNNDVRWFLNKHFVGKLNRLDNGNFILGNDIFISDGISKDIMEIDLLGKIYYQYSIPDGYYGSFYQDNVSLFILSNNLIQIDRQSGEFVKEVELDGKYDYFTYDNNTFKLHGSKNISINKESFEIKDIDSVDDDIKNFSYSLYYNQDEYKILKGVKFYEHNITEVSSRNILLFNYKKGDDDYLEYKFNFKKSNDYLIITGNVSNDDEVFVILDKFLDKNVYDMKDEYLVINQEGLRGKYSIYIQINDTIYKTNKYVCF